MMTASGGVKFGFRPLAAPERFLEPTTPTRFVARAPIRPATSHRGAGRGVQGPGAASAPAAAPFELAVELPRRIHTSSNTAAVAAQARVVRVQQHSSATGSSPTPRSVNSSRCGRAARCWRNDRIYQLCQICRRTPRQRQNKSSSKGGSDQHQTAAFQAAADAPAASVTIARAEHRRRTAQRLRLVILSTAGRGPHQQTGQQRGADTADHIGNAGRVDVHAAWQAQGVRQACTPSTASRVSCARRCRSATRPAWLSR